MKCKKCGSLNLTIVEAGPHKKLICADCKAFQTFLSKEAAFDFSHILIPKRLAVRIDSLLSCFIHRHETALEAMGEVKEVVDICNEIQKYTR
jgi:hypothetical protein